jgi:hypothetical protein
MTRILSALLILMLATTTSAAAQQTGPLVRYGKWLLAAGAIGMNLAAARAHDRAEDSFDEIEDACFVNSGRCALGPDGSYVDRQIENLYQASLHYDRSARRWLIAGETALVGAAVLFVWEMTRKTHKPDNIPFEPEVRTLRSATGVGLRFSF